MTKLLWLSDIHMTSAGARVAGHDPLAALERAAAHILAQHLDAEACIISGDIADDGRLESYRRVAKILSGNPMPILPLTGTHDQVVPLAAVLPPPGQVVDGALAYAFGVTAGRLICLDTQKPGSDAGQLSPEQLAWLDDTLAEGHPSYIFMHHPPLALGLPAQDPEGLEDPAAFLASLGRHPSVRHLFFGHVHRPISGSVNGIPFTAMGSTIFQAPLPYPSWTWETFRPAGDPPLMGIILLSDTKTIVHFRPLDSA